MDIMLIAGLWLDGSAWDDVAPALRELGHRPVPLTLPGQGDGRPSATLDDQVAAVLAAVDSASGRPAGGGALRRQHPGLAGRRRAPGAVAGVVLIGGFPSADGDALRRLLRADGRRHALPGLGPVRGAGLSPTWTRRPGAHSRLPRSPSPKGWHRAWSADRRATLRASRSCSSAPSSAPPRPRSGSTPASCPSSPGPSTSTFVDIDSGHWPMITSRPSSPGCSPMPPPAWRTDDGRTPADPWTPPRGTRSPKWSSATTACSAAAGASGTTPSAARRGSATARSRRTGSGPIAPTPRSCSTRTASPRGGASSAARRNCPTSSTGGSTEGRAAAPGLADHLLLRRQDAPRPRHRPGRSGRGARPDRPSRRRPRRGHPRGDRRPPGTGRFLFSATVELFEQYGFTRGRQVGKHAWIVSRVVDPA